MTGRYDGKGPTGDDLTAVLRDINARMMRVARPFCRTQRCHDLGIRAEKGRDWCWACEDKRDEYAADSASERLLGEELL